MQLYILVEGFSLSRRSFSTHFDALRLWPDHVLERRRARAHIRRPDVAHFALGGSCTDLGLGAAFPFAEFSVILQMLPECSAPSELEPALNALVQLHPFVLPVHVIFQGFEGTVSSITLITP